MAGEDIQTCVKALRLPTEGWAIAGGPPSGLIKGTLTIGRDGKASEVELQGGDSAGQQAAIASPSVSRDSTLPVQAVDDQKVYDYVAPQEIYFLPPNRFELTFCRRRPIIN